MTELRKQLECKLLMLTDIKIDTYKDTDLVCVFFKGKEFAHFHSDHVLDIRLSQKIIREEQLSRSINSTKHPDRSKNSRWIEVELYDEEDVDKLVHLVMRVCNELM